MRRSNDFQSGTTAVEFALTAVIFFLFLFGIVEMARVVYFINTMQEVTRGAARAATKTNFSDSGKMDDVRQRAIFRASSGSLYLAEPITDAHVRIDYMALVRVGSQQVLTPVASLPVSPMSNRSTCIADPNNANCIRFVRVRICQPGAATDCAPVPYTPLVPLIAVAFNSPTATTIVAAESLGL